MTVRRATHAPLYLSPDDLEATADDLRRRLEASGVDLDAVLADLNIGDEVTVRDVPRTQDDGTLDDEPAPPPQPR
jgi:hypothetical protein